MSVSTHDFGRIAVLMGGHTAERDISLLSGAAVVNACNRLGLNARAVDLDKQGITDLAEGQFDRAFVVLHGRGGEDGVVQGFLETLGVPYTGSGVAGSALAMNKLHCKQVWKNHELPTPDFCVMEAGFSSDSVAREVALPVAVKPVHEGSSFGISRVVDVDGLSGAWSLAREFDDLVMAEHWVDGDEYTVGILDGQALPVIRLETDREFYDFEAKYNANDTRYLCPCGLDADAEASMQALALHAFSVLGADGWGRVDLMMDAEGRQWLIEANTVPGLTDHSLVPMAAGHIGIEFDDLVLKILQTSLH